MKRMISSALLLSIFTLPVAGIVGCGEEAKVEKETTIKTPGGTTTETKTDTIKSTGDNPPVKVENK
jgi:hypothetical protein